MFGRKEANILVVKADSLAGFIAAEPAFAAIREAHPKSKISLLTTGPLQRVARASSYFDQVAGIPNLRDADARKEFVKQLKLAKFEKVYDLAGNDASKKLQSAMGPFGPKWFSASTPSRRRDAKAGLFAPLPDVGALASNAGIEVEERLPDLHWALSARKDSANMKPSWYGISGPFGLLLPSLNEANRWTPSGYAGLASMMAIAGFMPVLAGSKELHDFGDAIADEAPQLVDLTGKTDHLQLAALAHEAAFFVSDGAEEVHLAVSVGCEGVLITKNQSSEPAIDGRHVVSLTSGDGVGAVEPVFVWRTLSNMGLSAGQPDSPQSASAR